MLDYLIVGSGFFGSVCAYELTKAGFKCLIIEKRDHIGGNCYTKKQDNINIHVYGPHIFHTSNVNVWKWINQFVEFNNFILTPIANYQNELYPLPFNMWTFNKLWNVIRPDEAQKIIYDQSKHIINPKNLEEQAIKLVGSDGYYKLIEGYTYKQWQKDPKKLPKEIINRLPVRFTYDNNYFNDIYQGIPIGGYTQIFEKLLANIEVEYNTDYLQNKDKWNSIAKKIIYTGPIDEYYSYEYGYLEYKTTYFDHKKILKDNYQGIAVMNYTDKSIPYTRCIEHKHFEKSDSPVTWITHEYPIKYRYRETDPMYPVNDQENNAIYSKYKSLSKNNNKIIFGGRLAEYKYYDMHQIIETALGVVQKELENRI